jgi:hypothetical protein
MGLNLRRRVVWLLPFIVLCQSASVGASTRFPAKARVFVSATQVDVPEFNSLLASEGFSAVDLIPSVGVEITRPFGNWFEAGLRYNMRFLTRGVEGLNVNDSTSIAALRQDSVQGVARLTVLRTRMLRADFVAGLGGNNTRFELRNTAQDGKLTRANLADFFATPMACYGASVGIGAKGVYLTAEAGYEHNRIPDLVQTGAIGSSISVLNLSGPYVIVSAMFDGITATQR